MTQLPYKNQEHAALQILQQYSGPLRYGPLRYGLLRANEQSGKTGTYHYLIRLMLEQNLIERAYILCGSHDIELLSQCNKDVDEWHKSKVEVVFRQHFNKVRMTTTKTLIIVDESHLVEGVNQSLSRFIRDHGLTMAGTNEKMIRDNTYILSVDATPYAEESAIATNQCLPKFKITLADGDGYFGVKEYLESGLVRPTFELNNHRGRNTFTLLLQKYNQKYILVRIQEKRNKSLKWIKQYAELAGCDIKSFTSHFMNNKSQICITKDEARKHFEKYGKVIPCLEEEPEKTTIVFIDGRLRCGKRAPKKHIGFVWEASKSANTDVIRQSLLGRMCGYIGNDLCECMCECVCVYKVPDEKPLIFVPGRILQPQNDKKVIPLSDLERTIWKNPYNETLLTPRFANNLIPGRIQNITKRNGIIVTPCVPILFKLDEYSFDDSTKEGICRIKGNCLTKLISMKKKLVLDNPNLTQGQKDEISNALGDELEDIIDERKCHYRAYKGTQSQNAHKCHVEAYSNNSASKEHISDSPFLTFCVVHSGYQPLEGFRCIPGEVYAIFYTKAEGDARYINFESRISTVNNKTHFTIQPTLDVAQCPAGAIYGFSPEILSDSSQLREQLGFFIRMAKQGIGMFSRRFTALHNGEYIRLPRSIYGDKLEQLKMIFSELEREHSVRISFERKRFRPTIFSQHVAVFDHEIKFISWE